MEPIQSNKKIMIVVSVLSVILIIIIIVSLIIKKSTETTPNPISPTPVIPSPTLTPVPTEKAVAFPTVFIPVTGTPDEYISIQAQADKEWSQDYKDAHVKYPWIDKFPIKTDTYFVYFNSDTNKFIAKIYDKNQVDSIKLQIIDIFTENNIDYAQYGIEWKIAE